MNSTQASTLNPLTSSERESFLRQGWLLALDRERILIGWGNCDVSSAPNFESAIRRATGNTTEARIYAPDFYLQSANAFMQSEHSRQLTRDQFYALVMSGSDAVVNSPGLGIEWNEPSFAEFQTDWAEIHRGFKDRGLKKALPVVYNAAHYKIGPPQREHILRSLARLPRQLYLYGFWNDSEGMLGATPEVLFSSDGPGKISTMALAGTREKAADSKLQLLADPKERHEHQLVVDDIRERLAPFGRVRVVATEVLELPSLEHLLTRISLESESVLRLDQLVEALHPTPALGVSPRRLGFREMKRWDRFTGRGRFGAPFAAEWAEGIHCVVAIRGIQWKGSEVLLGSGCGVVEQSQLQREWAELALKRESVRRMLAL